MAAPMDGSAGACSPKTTTKSPRKKRKCIDDSGDAGKDTTEPKKKLARPDFTEIEFKVGLKDATSRFTVLERFVEEAEKFPGSTDYDIVAAYCRSSAECIEILNLLEGEKRKPKELCAILEALETILVGVASRLPALQSVGQAVTRRILSGHVGTIFYMLQAQNKTAHLKVALRLLSALVAQGDTAPRDVLRQVDLSHSAFPALLKRTDIKDPMDVRATTIHFMMSFLIIGDKDAVVQILEAKGFLNNIFPGLYADKLNVLEMVLPTIREKVVRNPDVSKTLKVRLCNQHTLTSLARLYRWTGARRWKKGQGDTEGPEGDEEAGASSEDRDAVVDMVHKLLLDLCCDFKQGINFYDKTYGTAGKSLNHVLTAFLKSLPEPYSSPHLTELVVGVLKACPDQLVWYLPELRTALTPRASHKWLEAMRLLHQAYAAQPHVAPCMTLSDRVTVHKLVTMAAATIIPPRDIWALLLTAIRHKSLLVQKEGLNFLLLVLRRIKATLDFCLRENALYTRGELDAFRNSFKDSMIKVCPDMATLLGCWSRAVKSVGSEPSNGAPEQAEGSEGEDDVDDLVTKGLPTVAPADLLLSVLRALADFQAAFPDVFSENFVNFSLLLEGVRRVAGDDDTSSHQEALLQLHLLRLLAESDLRQITWLKESVSGRSTLYLLLEMAVVTRRTPKMAVIATRLLQKLLVSTGLFPHVGGEIAVWIGHLVELAAREQDVLPFVERIFSAVLKDPFTYSEKVTASVTEAVTMETASAGDAMGSATTNSDHLIDTILSMDDVDMEGDAPAHGEGEPGDPTDSEGDHSSRFPFSALVPAALKLWKEEKDGSDKTDIDAYLSGVIHHVLHAQTDPAPLAILLQQEDALTLDPSAQRWVPGAKKVKSSSSTELPDPSTPLPELLTATFTGGHDLLLTPECEAQLREACRGVTCGESEAAVRQLLLYARTHALSCLQDARGLAVVELYLSLVGEVLGAVRSREDHTPMEEDDQETSGEPGTGDPTDAYSSLQVREPSRDAVLSRLVTLVATHPDLQTWYLWESSLDTRGKALKLGSKLRPVVTARVAAILNSVPGEVAASLKTVLGMYTTKAASQFATFVEDLQSDNVSLDSGRDVVDAMLALVGLLSWSDVVTAVQGLAGLPTKVLVQKKMLTAPGSLLLSLLTTVTATLQSTPARLTNFSESLSLRAMSQLCTLAITAPLADLDTALCDLVDLYPLYTLGSNQDHFTQCLQAPPGGPEHKMAVAMVTHSEAAQRWFQQYWSDLSKKQKTSIKWDVVDVVGAYVGALVAAESESSEHEIGRIRDSYWTDLCDWVTEDEEAGETVATDRLNLLTLLTENTKDTALLESCWKSLLAHIVSARRLSTGRILYLYTLSQCLSRCKQGSGPLPGGQDPLPVWEVWVGAALSAMVNLMSTPTAKGKKHNAGVVGQLLEQVTHVVQTLQSDGSALSEVVRPVWGKVVKAGLRHQFSEPRMLRVLAGLVDVVYPCDTEVIPVSNLYEMILSHSQFLPTMLQEKSSATKDALVELLLKVVQHTSPSACQSSHVTALLGAYGATLSPTDQRLLLLVSLYESRGCSMDEHKPFLWGPKAVEHHSVKKSLGTSLWRRATSERVMEALNSEMLERSCLNFPLQRKLMPKDVVPAEGLTACDVYDPCFLLPLFSHVLTPGHIVNCFEFVEKGCLGYVLSALSCHDDGLRGAAYHVLAEYSRHVDETRFAAKDQIQYLLQVVRQSVASPNVKLAAMVTTFLVRAAKLMVTPDAPLYSAINEFLLLKPAMDIQNVPEFYKLFNSSSLEFKTDRAWMLSLLADGFRETADYRLMERRYTLKLVLSFHDSSLSDAFTRCQVLKVVRRAVGQRTVSAELIKQHGLLAWINAAIASSASDVDRQKLLVDILDTMWKTMLAGRQARRVKGHDVNKSREGDVSQGGDMEEVDGDKESRRHLLPLAFTNEMLHVTLHLLKLMSCQDHDDHNVFRHLAGCLRSIVDHLRTTVAAMDTLPPLCVHVKATDVLNLLHLWSSLQREEDRKLEVRGLLSDLGHTWTGPVAETTQKKTTRHSRKHQETTDNVTNQKEAKFCLTSVRDILKVITHWGPSERSGDVKEGSCDPAEVAAILYVSTWSLNHVHRLFPRDFDLVCDVLRWLRPWVCDVKALQRSMVSEGANAQLLVGQLLITYGLCSRCLRHTEAPVPFPTDSAGAVPTETLSPPAPYALTSHFRQTHTARTLTTEMLAAVVDHVAGGVGGTLNQTRLGQILARPSFTSALGALPAVGKGDRDALCLLMQELWMDANVPRHFTTVVKDDRGSM